MEPQSALPAAYFRAGTSSFVDFLAEARPDLLPASRPAGSPETAVQAPHGTTIVAAKFADGVVLAGDQIGRAHV